MPKDVARVIPETVNIRPGVNVLSVLRHLNYKPWYALGEFVDNAVQSALDNWDRLKAASGGSYRLVVHIELNPDDGGRIVIRDNAAGIAVADYQRAFRTAEVPPDRKGLSEFGMGMKSAGFWFSTQWQVRTKALDEDQAGRIRFDLPEIMEDSLEQVPVQFEPADVSEHYTEVTLNQPQKMPIGRTLGKIKDHLTGIYRNFVRTGRLKLFLNGEELQFEEHKILVAPDFRDPSGPLHEWRKNINISLPREKRIHGYVALRGERGSTSEAGLALFRRGRLIVGSGDETYRPNEIFGASTDARFQRVFGELHFEGFEVSHTKDGFLWEELEEEFLLRLKDEVEKEPLCLLSQARGHSYRRTAEDIRRGAQAATSSTSSVMQSAASAICNLYQKEPASEPPPEELTLPAEVAAKKEFTISFQEQDWIISIELASDPSIGSWLDISQNERKERLRQLKVRLNCAHPFMQRFAGTTAESIEPLIRIGVALAIAETVSRDQGVRQAGSIRRHVNELLRTALSSPATTIR